MGKVGLKIGFQKEKTFFPIMCELVPVQKESDTTGK